MKNRFVRYGLLILLFFIITIALSILKSTDSSFDYNYLDKLEYSDGTQFQSKEIENKKLVIYFWAVWCKVCEINFPFFQTNYSNFQNSNIQILSIEEGMSGKQKLKNYLNKKQINYPVIIGTQELLYQSNINAFPTTIFINSKGKVVFVDTGILNPISFYFRLLLLEIF
jgi:thiol-disulfide isomerase/thioredoxin